MGGLYRFRPKCISQHYGLRSGLIEDQAWSIGHNEEKYIAIMQEAELLINRSTTKGISMEYYCAMEMYILQHTQSMGTPPS